eukprot:647145-Pleurochrysis_carterae.AAC.5
MKACATDWQDREVPDAITLRMFWLLQTVATELEAMEGAIEACSKEEARMHEVLERSLYQLAEKECQIEDLQDKAIRAENHRPPLQLAHHNEEFLTDGSFSKASLSCADNKVQPSATDLHSPGRLILNEKQQDRQDTLRRHLDHTLYFVTTGLIQDLVVVLLACGKHFRNAVSVLVKTNLVVILFHSLAVVTDQCLPPAALIVAKTRDVFYRAMWYGDRCVGSVSDLLSKLQVDPFDHMGGMICLAGFGLLLPFIVLM